MQGSTDEEAQARRRRDAWKSVLLTTAWLLLSAAALFALRWAYVPEGFWGAVLLVMALLELGMLIPVWILLKIRLKEIEGGEEDAAAQY